MKIHLALTLAVSALPALAHAGNITGSYVEARSASVWAGACHYNAEVTTRGREAVLAWRIAQGALDGTKLDGLSVVAVVTGDANLAEEHSARRAVLYIDQRATVAQQKALTTLIEKQAKQALGTVVVVRPRAMAFTESTDTITVTVGESAQLVAKKYPCEHCRMPAQQWYSPLVPSAKAEVAQSLKSGFSEKALGVSWQHEAADNVFVGTFRF